MTVRAQAWDSHPNHHHQQEQPLFSGQTRAFVNRLGANIFGGITVTSTTQCFLENHSFLARELDESVQKGSKVSSRCLDVKQGEIPGSFTVVFGDVIYYVPCVKMQRSLWWCARKPKRFRPMNTDRQPAVLNSTLRTIHRNPCWPAGSCTRCEPLWSGVTCHGTNHSHLSCVYWRKSITFSIFRPSLTETRSEAQGDTSASKWQIPNPWLVSPHSWEVWP